MKKDLASKPSSPAVKAWDDRLPLPGQKWQHESRLGTYDCTIDKDGVITMTHRALGWVRTVRSYDELKMVDVKPAQVSVEPASD